MLKSIDINQLITDYVIPWGLNIIYAFVIFIIGRIVIKIVLKLIEKLMRRSSLDTMLINFIQSIVSAILWIFVLSAALSKLGIDTTSLIALLGAAGLAIGLALQGSLQNFAAGVMLLLFKPFKVGDFVEAGNSSGIVEQINIFTTTLRTGDNKEVIVPNGSIYNGTITNYSARDTRRIDMVFSIGYEDDINRARVLLEQVIREEERVLDDPEPLIAVSELANSSVNFVVRPWVKTADYWSVKFALTENIKTIFDANDISIPYPQMDVHMSKVA
jgi:small conductance mechanosensitive channel